jgi:dienelactone hydrolase
VRSGAAGSRLPFGGMLLLAALTFAPGAAHAQAALDCDGPPGDPAPGTPEWHQRELDNAFCGDQRGRDLAANPAYLAEQAALNRRKGSPVTMDAFRDPEVLDGVRFRHQEVSFTARDGQRLSGAIFRPCDGSCRDLPRRLRRHELPYPGVVVVHGGGANPDMYLWGSEALAEAGYMVLAFQVPGGGGDAHYEYTKDALDFLLSTPRRRTAAGEANPRWSELDRRRIGLAGHSAGGVAVSRLGQEDPRVSAIVAWDRAQSRPLPPELRLRTPALYVVADFNCQQVPICMPIAYDAPPDPRGPGNKDEDFQRTSAAGVDSMKVALRAATHLDFTQLGPGTGSRHGAVVTSYYTLAWFDRYLRRSEEALDRLTATRFDDSADVHNISGGTYDARNRRNVPARIAGQQVADRLSFHFRSAFFLARGRYRCDDMRAGCPRPGARGGVPPCLPRRLAVRAGRLGSARLGASYATLPRRHRVVRDGRRASRFCVRGGGRFWVGRRRGRIDLVATTARGHRSRRIAPGRRAPGAAGGRQLAPGLFEGRPAGGGRLVYRVRGGRIRWLAVVEARRLAEPRALVRRLRGLGLR